MKFKDVPLKQVAKVVKAYSFECMTKVPGLTFHPTNNNTLPTPNPISTAELFPDVTVYYKVKSSVPVTELRHRVFHFIKDKHVWMNSKQIHDNRPMDAAVIF